MSASQTDDLINSARLRLGIKRAFTGDVNEVLSELFQFIYRMRNVDVRKPRDKLIRGEDN